MFSSLIYLIAFANKEEIKNKTWGNFLIEILWLDSIYKSTAEGKMDRNIPPLFHTPSWSCA
jgi:hypothetical protein